MTLRWSLLSALQFYSRNKPLTCEIDAYGDFLQALGPDATPNVCDGDVKMCIY